MNTYITINYVLLAIVFTFLFVEGMSGVFITMINAFMNTPKGFNIPYYLSTGKIIDVNAFAVLNTPTTWVEIGHVIGSTIFAGSAFFLAYFAYKLLKTNGTEREYYKKAAKIAAAISTHVVGVFKTANGLTSIILPVLR